MEHQIVSKPAFTVVGMKYRGKNEHDEIAQLLGREPSPKKPSQSAF